MTQESLNQRDIKNAKGVLETKPKLVGCSNLTSVLGS